jgi:hypothetical protein
VKDDPNGIVDRWWRDAVVLVLCAIIFGLVCYGMLGGWTR